MSDNKDYMARLSRARRRRKRRVEPLRIAVAAGVLVLVLGGAGFFLFSRSKGKTTEVSETQEVSPTEETTPAPEPETEPTLSPEEEAEIERTNQVQAVLDSYTNLGFIQVEGYLNVREAPENGKIIGKLEQNSACEVLEESGEWLHITSGGIDGYIHGQYVTRGEEAIEAARPYVIPRAVVLADKLNIRSEPVTDAANVVGQVLKNERYAIYGAVEGWIQIEDGYISADYVEVRYALNEAKKLDLVAMAIDMYDNLVISKVDNYLNIREEPKSDGKIIGKMTSKAAGEILETLDGWYKIKSGKITGYISADPQYTATGQAAKDIAMQEATLMAIVNTDMLNVRTEPTTDASIWTQISKEERYHVLEQLDGWVQIELDTEDSDKAYIATRDNNVEVRYALAEAIKFSPVEEAAQAAASLRSKLVNYALQFVGNRYVWGGTSLTNGVDCSGFTMQVMKQFGVSLPHYSGSQAQMGKAVNSSQMRPGDLVFYANSSGTVNHVAIYIGNGQIVHAASSRSGIKISPWNYRTPKTIRNMLGD